MTIKFYSTNLIDQSVITASTENSLFPASNLSDPRRTKVFRSTTNSDEIVFDFQETSQVNAVFLTDNPFDGFGISTAVAKFNGTNTWASPAATESLTFDATFGYGMNDFTTTHSYRFMRLDLTSSLSYCELSNLFVGKSIELLNGRSINYGWTYQSKDNSKITENRYGQRFSDVINRQKQLNISFSNLSKDHLDQIFEIYDDKGLTKPFYIQLGCSTMINNNNRFSGMVYFNSIPQITNRFFNNYSMSMTLEEAK